MYLEATTRWLNWIIMHLVISDHVFNYHARIIMDYHGSLLQEISKTCTFYNLDLTFIITSYEKISSFWLIILFSRISIQECLISLVWKWSMSKISVSSDTHRAWQILVITGISIRPQGYILKTLKFILKWVIEFNGFSGDSRQRGPYSPYKPCNQSLYIGIIIFLHINVQSTGHMYT